MTIKTYSELSTLLTFKERFEYLKLPGLVGKDTFGFERYLNQRFYRSSEWKKVRDEVIARDLGCDLGIPGYEISVGRVIIHHMNPMSVSDISSASENLLNPEYLITTTHQTHNAIHYGDESSIFTGFQEREPNDTCLWK